MGFLLLILFLGFFVIPLFRVFVTVRRARNSYRDFFNAAAGMGGASGRGDRRQRQPQPEPRRKIYSKDEGEYVDFQEIECSATTDQSAGESRRTETVVEQQVTDVEWEELP